MVRRARLSVQLDLTATPDAPGVARRAVAEIAEAGGASDTELDAVRTIVSEGVTNAVRHAYGPDAGPVYVDAAVLDHDLTILISDTGRGTRVASPRPGLGMGWKLVAQLADRWAVVQRGERGTMLYARLSLAG